MASVAFICTDHFDDLVTEKKRCEKIPHCEFPQSRFVARISFAKT